MQNRRGSAPLWPSLTAITRRGSRNAFCASLKSTPCLATLAASFCVSHSNFTSKELPWYGRSVNMFYHINSPGENKPMARNDKERSARRSKSSSVYAQEKFEILSLCRTAMPFYVLTIFGRPSAQKVNWECLSKRCLSFVYYFAL